MRLCPYCGNAVDSGRLVCISCTRAPAIVEGFTAYAPEAASASEGFRPEYFERLAALEADNFWFRARNAFILDALHRYFPNMERMLEIGCGTGFVLNGVAKDFPHTRLSGSEIFVEGLAFAARRVPNAELVQMDARQLPFLEEFDVVGAFDVIEHIHEDEQVISQMWRATRVGGGLVITVPQHPALWSAQDEHACHVRRYRRGEMERKLRAAGFSIRMSTSFVSLLLPLLAISRLRNGNIDGNRDARSGLKLPHALNQALYAVLDIERRLVNLGVRLPIGGTRLVVATK